MAEYIYISPQDQIDAEAQMFAAGPSVQFLKTIGASDLYTDLRHTGGAYFGVAKGTPIEQVQRVSARNAGMASLYHIRQQFLPPTNDPVKRLAATKEILDLINTTLAELF